MISIVICSISGKRFDAVCEQFRLALGSEPYEIIRIPDARSMCDGYNRGLAISQGEIVIFCHEDIEIWADDFANRLKGHLKSFDVIGVAGTDLLIQPGWIAAGPPHIFGQVAHGIPGGIVALMVYGATSRVIPNIQAMDGIFLAFRRPVIQQLRWDQQTFTRFHCYDTDCTYRAFRAGFRLGVALDLPILHMSAGNFDETWVEEAKLWLKKHGMKVLVPQPFIRMRVDYPNKEAALAAMKAFYNSLPS